MFNIADIKTRSGLNKLKKKIDCNLTKSTQIISSIDGNFGELYACVPSIRSLRSLKQIVPTT